jgi:hypothetical protein
MIAASRQLSIFVQEHGFDEEQVGAARQLDDPPRVLGVISGVRYEGDLLAWDNAQDLGSKLA